MKFALRPAIAALMSAGLAAGAAYGQSLPELKFSGFGTLGAVHSSEDKADFVSGINQPNGAGATRSWSTTPDSKLGAQLDVIFNPQWSAVLQIVSQHKPDNSYRPTVEWANVKFQATPELSVRAGRIAMPTFLVSDTRYVGYAQPWVRPPVEVYGMIPITTSDGVDATFRRQFGSVTNTVQAYYGGSTTKLKEGETTAKPSWGINDSAQFGDLMLRAGYSSNKVTLDVPGVNALLAGVSAFTRVPGPIGAQATALTQKYAVKDITVSYLSLAASYDPGQWFVMTEFVDFSGASFMADSKSWYVTGGYRFGSLTPYATYANTKSQMARESGIPLPAAAPLNAGLNQLVSNQFNGAQNSVSAGLRWDFMKNVALKAQYDHINLGDGSSGRLSAKPGFTPGGNVNLFSVALDFVF